MKSVYKQINEKVVISVLLICSLLIIISYQLTKNQTELITGADYYFNIAVQLSISSISACIFYLIIQVLPAYRNRKNTIRFISTPLVNICYVFVDMYKHILNESSAKALRFDYLNSDTVTSKIDLLDMTKTYKNSSIFFIGNSFRFSSPDDPIAFAIIMQINSMKNNIEKVLKYKSLDFKLENILLNMYNTGVMDLVSLVSNKKYDEDTYDFFNKQSKNNKIDYHNFLRFSLQLWKYCYENELFNKDQIKHFETT